MRFVLPLVALCALSSAPLRADMFNITLSDTTVSGSGTFSTDGTCQMCFPGTGGLLSLTINIGRSSGTDAFDIIDDFPLQTPLYIRFDNTLLYDAINSETGEQLLVNGTSWNLSSAGSVIGSGTYSITPAVPEPSSLFLVMPLVAIVGLRWRHQRHRV